MKFSDFEKQIKDIKYKKGNDWEIFLPFGTSRDIIQQIIDISRDNLVIDWHVVYSQPTKDNDNPEIRIFWDRMQNPIH